MNKKIEPTDEIAKARWFMKDDLYEHYPGFLPTDVLRTVDRALDALVRETASARPLIVCLCGSTRYHQEWLETNYRETMMGHIVLSVAFYPHGHEHGETVGITPEQKAMLDELYHRKIDLADEVFVINVGGYVGESTRREVEYAKAHGKRIRWLEPDPHPSTGA